MIDLRAIGSGYHEVFVDGVKVSQHTTERGAAERAVNEYLSNPDATVEYRRDYVVVVEGNASLQTIEEMQTQSGYKMNDQSGSLMTKQ